ncbi:MAG: TIGR02996 domain-containing protein [Planctomycetes bacterium]|nr:TIGR02996 domain-containing protein [Planctomycetota bacterium]
MSSDERAFLDAIREHPHDDTARLVYADWLAENGRADRGEFIRVDVELARTPPTTEGDERRRRVLLERRADLLKRHKSAWLAPFLPFAKEESFERGFVQALEVPANTFLQNAERWFELTPLTRVKITASRVWNPHTAAFAGWTEPLFTSPHLARLESLDLENQSVTGSALEALAAHDDLPKLRELLLQWNGLRSEGAAVLANLPQLRNLEALDLRNNSITDTGARALAGSPYLTRMTELRLSRNPIRDRTWALLEDRFGDALVG